jgi:hypothetical protein
MKKLLIALLFATSPAWAVTKEGVGKTLALVSLSGVVCGTSDSDQEVVMRAIREMARMKNWDMAELYELAGNAFEPEQLQLMREYPGLGAMAARSTGACEAVESLVQSSRSLMDRMGE